jgi:type IV secretory pathway VirD2 relaxase
VWLLAHVPAKWVRFADKDMRQHENLRRFPVHGFLDLRPEAGQHRADFERTLRLGRLQVLERFGLAREIEPGVWRLSDQLEPTLRELGKRGDIIKAINRSLAARGQGTANAQRLLIR